MTITGYDMINLDEFLHELKFQDGIWRALDIDKISYPNDGNNSCYEIEDKSFWFKNRNKIIYEVINKYSINGPLFDVGGGMDLFQKILVNWELRLFL